MIDTRSTISKLGKRPLGLARQAFTRFPSQMSQPPSQRPNPMERRPSIYERLGDVNWLMVTPALAAPVLPAVKHVARHYYPPEKATKIFFGFVVFFICHGFYVMSVYARSLSEHFQSFVRLFMKCLVSLLVSPTSFIRGCQRRRYWFNSEHFYIYSVFSP